MEPPMACIVSGLVCQTGLVRMTLDELDAARIELVGGAFGSKSKFAKLLGLKGHHSLRVYYRRGSVPLWIEGRIQLLRENKAMREGRYTMAEHLAPTPQGEANQ